MSWRIVNHPAGGLAVEHDAHPRFTARWTSGVFPLDRVESGSFFWTDEGSDVDDALHLFGFDWVDPPPSGGGLERLMREAACAIEAHVTGGM